MSFAKLIHRHGIKDVAEVYRNASAAVLCELAVKHEKDSKLTSTGALSTISYEKTGRSPKDKRIVEEDSTKKDVWWGSINIPLSPSSFEACKSRAIKFLNSRERLYVFDGFAGWDPSRRIKVRVIVTRPYHALFMNDMLIRPTKEQLEKFGEPDWVVYNAGEHDADPAVPGVGSKACVALSFEKREFVILGTQYAGEMKKGIFTVVNYLAPKQGMLSMHASANEGVDGSVSIFFGLSGTGKTTLSADPHRRLIGDDEHVWSDTGVYNIEGGCYAKCIGLSPETEPDIYYAVKWGAVVENVVLNPETRAIDYNDVSITENTRVAYPLEHISNAKIPAIGGQPNNIIMLTCDAFGVLPPVSLLTPEQAMYHFMSGYTAKVAGTEVGIKEPQATFSACFGAPFMVWHPSVYAELLAKRMNSDGTRAWLINTGWTGGAYGVGKRMSLRHTRALIDAIHNGSLIKVEMVMSPVFNLRVPTTCPGVPSEVLQPEKTWANKEEFYKTINRLARMFVENFKEYDEQTSDLIKKAGPTPSASADGKGFQILKEH